MILTSVQRVWFCDYDKVTARFHEVRLMNVENRHCQAPADAQTKPTC